MGVDLCYLLRHRSARGPPCDREMSVMVVFPAPRLGEGRRDHKWRGRGWQAENLLFGKKAVDSERTGVMVCPSHLLQGGAAR